VQCSQRAGLDRLDRIVLHAPVKFYERWTFRGHADFTSNGNSFNSAEKGGLLFRRGHLREPGSVAAKQDRQGDKFDPPPFEEAQ
jgi:hypothetical protein